MKYILGIGIVTALIVFAVNWGEVLVTQLVVRSLLVGIGFILALTAAKKAIVTFVISSGTTGSSSSRTGGNQEAPDQRDLNASLEQAEVEDPGDLESEPEKSPAPEGGEEMDPGQIAEMISGQMSEDE